MLEKMMVSSKETVTVEELKSLIFASEEMNSLSSTLQGVEHGGEVSQNWVCSATSVPSLRSRTVGICRMEECTNLGDGAHEVKYFILILCPTNIKGIKNHNVDFTGVFNDILNFVRYKNCSRNRKNFCNIVL